MPYVPKRVKKYLAKNNPPAGPGDLTYLFQQDIKRYIEHMGEGYGTFAQVLGALEGAKADFVDRVLLPYEHKKHDENGDVWS